METITIVATLIWILVLIFIGFFFGKKLVNSPKFKKMVEKSMNKQLSKGAIQVIEGKRKNKTEINGKMVEVVRFKVTDDNDHDKIIDLTRLNFKNGI